MELLERDHFLELLNNGFRNTLSGQGHTFLISGEAGIGKSSLARVFLQEVEDRCQVYSSLCDSLFSPRPLGPVYDLALQLDPDLIGPGPWAGDRTLLFSKLVKTLSKQAGPCVVLVEDIHWADAATLDFIKYFARRIRDSRTLLLLTYRDNEVLPSHPLRNVIGELLPGSFTRMNLPPFSKSMVEELAEKKGYNGKDLYEVSGGNPFYVTEILSSYSTGVPDNIRDSILSVYNKLPEHTKNAWQLLSVIPEGLDSEWLSSMDAQFLEAIESCIANGIIIIRQNRTFFKHELFRRTIEASLSPFRRLQLNKRILELFQSLFEERGEIERIVHYAKNAGEKQLVSTYAPLAAAKAVRLGAHTEATRLYLAAIEYHEQQDTKQLLPLYEAYSYECYLTSLIEEAIIYQAKALKIREAAGDKKEIGNSLRFLSRLWWYSGRRELAEKYGMEAIAIFEELPVSKAKAMAWSNISQLRMLADDAEGAIKWGTAAISMAKESEDDETLAHALNNVGTAEGKIAATENAGREKLEESLSISLNNSFHEHAARAYTNLFSIAVSNKNYEVANERLEEGLNYCEEKDLQSWKSYILSWKARMYLETGRWKEALSVTGYLCSFSRQPAINMITVAVVKATIAARTGNGHALELLQDARRIGFEMQEYQRIIPVAIAGLEYEWLRNERFFSKEEMDDIVSLVRKANNSLYNQQAAYWIQKARKIKTVDPDPAVFHSWARDPYEKAILLSEGTAEDKRRALSVLQELGATVTCEKIKAEMRATGIRNIPRGMRASTRSNPAQLTSRELDILHLLKTGAKDKEIAGSLFISPKTVGHHISSILFKLEVASRAGAVKEAENLGILK
jgi:DNA-binding CsgD family transcriptional regulator/tetratricopeptide (TPR) repeat protein